MRFDELKTTVQDVSKKSVQIHDLWKEFHKNLTSVDKIPSNIVDEITDPYESVARNLYATRNESIPSLGKNFIELEKLTEEIGKTLVSQILYNQLHQWKNVSSVCLEPFRGD